MEPLDLWWLVIGGVLGIAAFVVVVRLYLSEESNVEEVISAGLLGLLAAGITMFMWPVLVAIGVVNGLGTVAAWSVRPRPCKQLSWEPGCPHMTRGEVRNSYLGVVGYVCHDCGESLNR